MYMQCVDLKQETPTSLGVYFFVHVVYLPRSLSIEIFILLETSIIKTIRFLTTIKHNSKESNKQTNLITLRKLPTLVSDFKELGLVFEILC